MSLERVAASLRNAKILYFYPERISTDLSQSHSHHFYYLILNYIHIAALRDTFLSLSFITPIASIWLTTDALHLRMLFIPTSNHFSSIMSFQENWYFLSQFPYPILHGFKLHDICGSDTHSGIVQYLGNSGQL